MICHSAANSGRPAGGTATAISSGNPRRRAGKLACFADGSGSRIFKRLDGHDIKVLHRRLRRCAFIITDTRHSIAGRADHGHQHLYREPGDSSPSSASYDELGLEIQNRSPFPAAATTAPIDNRRSPARRPGHGGSRLCRDGHKHAMASPPLPAAKAPPQGSE